jgi:hypothetical protein
MVEALDSLMTASEVSTTAAKMASLINTKEANLQVGEAATAAAAAAAAAVAPASLRCPSAIALGIVPGVAAAAAAELADASAKAAAQQQQQKAAQQQQHRSSLRHQLQLQALVGEVGSPGLQSPQSPGTNRSSKSWLAEPDAAASSLQHCSSQIQQQHQQQQLLGPRASSPPASQSGSSTSRQSPLRRAVHQDSLAVQEASAGGVDAAGASRDSRCSSAVRASFGGLAVMTDMKSFSQHSSRPTQLASPSRSSLSSASGAASGSPAAAAAAGAEQLQSQEQQPCRSSMASAGGSSTSRQRQSRCSSPTALSKGGCAEVPPASPKPSTPAGAAAAGTAIHTPRSPRAAAAAAAASISGPSSSRDRSPSRLKSGISRPSEPSSPQPAAAEQRCSSPKHSVVLPSQAQQSSPLLCDTSAANEGQASEPAGAAVAVVQQLKQPQELSSLYGLALSASVCMADLVRQVGPKCC